MPICPKCGKCLSTEQALTYHLQKKNKCGSIKCAGCNKQFNTKLELQMHMINCDKNKVPSVDELIELYNVLPIVKYKDGTKDILFKSPALSSISNKDHHRYQSVGNDWHICLQFPLFIAPSFDTTKCIEVSHCAQAA